MSLSSVEVGRLVALGAPVLCVDTCTILDVIRDVTRETVNLADVQAGLSLLHAAETQTKLVILMAEQVSAELSDNLSDVEQEAERKLGKFVAQSQRIHEIVTAFGATGVLNTTHFNGHVGRAKVVLNRWKNIALTAQSDKDVAGRAFARVMAPRTPARKGKESMKDCVVIETYLEAARQLRAAGLSSPIVFASSNTKEYHAPNTSHLQPDIAADFSVVVMDFAPNFGAAKYSLGL